jgi:hypothetical protein
MVKLVVEGKFDAVDILAAFIYTLLPPCWY